MEMVTIWEVIDRSRDGLMMDEKEWDMGVWKQATELAKEYGVIYDPDDLTPRGDVADDIFEAAVQMVANLGVYNVTSRRAIKFTEKEIKDSIRNLKSELFIGAGKERIRFAHRDAEDRKPITVTGGHVNCTEEVAPRMYRAMAELPCVDHLIGFNLKFVAGRRVRSLPYEVLASLKQMAVLKEAITGAGKPGLHLTYYPESTDAGALVSILNPLYGIRPTDAIRLCVLPELKIQDDYLAAAAAANSYGCFTNSQGFSVLGGYAGGPATAVITVIASSLAGYLCYRADHQYAPNICEIESEKFTYAANWTISQAILAHTRNIPAPIDGVLMVGPEPGNVNSWRELAVRTMRYCVSGAYPFVPQPWLPQRDNLLTPLQMRFAHEVASSLAENGLKNEEITELMKKIAPKFLPLYDIPANQRYPHLKGLSFDEAYDETGRPIQRFVEGYENAKGELRELGFPI